MSTVADTLSDRPAARPETPPAGPPRAPRPVTRRRFLRVAVPATLGGVIAAGLASWGDWLGLGRRLRWSGRGWAQTARAYSHAWLPPAERIVRHFDYLTLDRAGVERYVREYERVFGRAELRHVARNQELYTKYLMSTDFFLNGADERRVVRFVALYHPYTTPCWNPLVPPGAAMPGAGPPTA